VNVAELAGSISKPNVLAGAASVNVAYVDVVEPMRGVELSVFGGTPHVAQMTGRLCACSGSEIANCLSATGHRRERRTRVRHGRRRRKSEPQKARRATRATEPHA
jgi:hypothetical protein